MKSGPAGDRYRLWLLIAAPVIWSLHLLVSYATASVWCAKFADSTARLGPVPALIGWYTAAALVGIGIVGVDAYRRHQYGTEATPHDLDTPDDRHRFLGFATLLLAGLSAVATIYVALVGVFFETCR